jgi:hypothetical protein
MTTTTSMSPTANTDTLSADHAPVSVRDDLVAPQAVDLALPELLALDPRDLLPVNVDVGSASLVVLGAAAQIQSYRDQLVTKFGEEEAKAVDRLQLLAQVALEAHATHRQLVDLGVDVLALSNQVVEARHVLLAEVRALIARKVLSAGVIGELQGTHGYKNQCLDVLQLVSLMKRNWTLIQSKTGLPMEDIDRAEALAHQLALALGVREQGPRSPSGDLRQRAYTLLATTYDDARRMITYLRWKERDADRIAPSLFRGRSNGRRASIAEPIAFRPEAGGEDVPAPGMPGAPPFISG